MGVYSISARLTQVGGDIVEASTVQPEKHPSGSGYSTPTSVHPGCQEHCPAGRLQQY